MKLGNVVEAGRAATIIRQYAIDDRFFKLNFKLDRLGRKLAEDMKSFDEANKKLFDEFGEDSVLFTSANEIANIKPNAQGQYIVTAATFDEKYKGTEGITEAQRGKLMIPATRMPEYSKKLNATLDEEIEAPTSEKIPLELFDGITTPRTDANGQVNPTLSELVIDMRDFIEDD